GSLFFVSDLVPGLPWVHLPITMGYDRFAELLVEEKGSLFEKTSGKKAFLFFTHDPKVACAHLRFEEGKYVAEPVELASLN
ncbi:MAG: MBL fold metallo-hydrolase, partial [Parachlamydia sp.]|nr:MBL fold metallo-hydrolase [Parachlamydia sp.]